MIFNPEVFVCALCLSLLVADVTDKARIGLIILQWDFIFLMKKYVLVSTTPQIPWNRWPNLFPSDCDQVFLVTSLVIDYQ